MEWFESSTALLNTY